MRKVLALRRNSRLKPNPSDYLLKMRGGIEIGKTRLIAAIIAASVFVIDMITKAVITHTFVLGESMEVINGFFDIVYVINRGPPLAS